MLGAGLKRGNWWLLRPLANVQSARAGMMTVHEASGTPLSEVSVRDNQLTSRIDGASLRAGSAVRAIQPHLLSLVHSRSFQTRHKTRASKNFAKDINTLVFDCRSLQHFEQILMRIDEFDATNVSLAIFRLNGIRLGSGEKIPPKMLEMLEEKFMEQVRTNSGAVPTKSLIGVINSLSWLAHKRQYVVSPDNWVTLQFLLRDRYLDQLDGKQANQVLQALAAMGRMHKTHGVVPKLVDGLVESLLSGDKLVKEFRPIALVHMVNNLFFLRSKCFQVAELEEEEEDFANLESAGLPASDEEDILLESNRVASVVMEEHSDVGKEAHVDWHHTGNSQIIPLGLYYAIDLHLDEFTENSLLLLMSNFRRNRELLPVGFAAKLMLTFVDKLDSLSDASKVNFIAAASVPSVLPMAIPNSVLGATLDSIDTESLALRELSDLLWIVPVNMGYFASESEQVRRVQALLAVALEQERERIHKLANGEESAQSTRELYSQLRNFSYLIFRTAWTLQSLVDSGVSKDLIKEVRDSIAFVMDTEPTQLRPVTMALLGHSRTCVFKDVLDQYLDDKLLGKIDGLMDSFSDNIYVHDIANIVEVFNAKKTTPPPDLMKKLRNALEREGAHDDPTHGLDAKRLPTSIGDALLAIAATREHAGSAGPSAFGSGFSDLQERFEQVVDLEPNTILPAPWARALWAYAVTETKIPNFMLESSERALERSIDNVLQETVLPTNTANSSGLASRVFAQHLWAFAKVGYAPEEEFVLKAFRFFDLLASAHSSDTLVQVEETTSSPQSASAGESVEDDSDHTALRLAFDNDEAMLASFSALARFAKEHGHDPRSLLSQEALAAISAVDSDWASVSQDQTISVNEAAFFWRTPGSYKTS